LTAEQAISYHSLLISQIVRMLCDGLVHGDLSEYNVLVDADGPVIIDLPQAVDAAANNHARNMLLRDVGNMRDYFGRFAPDLLHTNYGSEMWKLYQSGELHPDSQLSGNFEDSNLPADVRGILHEIEAARLDHEARLLAIAAPS
jgi:RIO kinase 1